jgi:hypothetical protein
VVDHPNAPSLRARSARFGRGRRAQRPRASARRERSDRAREHGREHGGAPPGRGWATNLGSPPTATTPLAATDAKITDAMRDKAKQNADELGRKVGQIAIEAPSSARVTVDGKPVDLTQREPVPVAPGRHTVEAAFEGRLKSVVVECLPGNITSAKLDFVAGDASYPHGDEPRHGSSWSTGKIVTVSALAAGAVAGGVLFFVFQGSAQSNVDEAKSLLGGGSCVGVTSDACSKAATLKDDRDSNVTLSTVSLVAGGVLAAGAVAAVVFWPKTSREHARITPIVAPGYGGAAFVGRF